MREDWIGTQLKYVGRVVSGGTPKTNILEYWNGDIAWITPADLSGYTNKYITKGRKSITKLGLENSSAKLMPKGSVLFSSRAPIGYIVIAKNEISTNQGFKSLIPYDLLNNEFLYYYLKGNIQLAESLASGTTFKELSGKAFSELPIVIPPLPEQRAIVAKIEQLFSELDNGIDNLKTAQSQLKIYRQSVLKKAFEGELTKEWREKQINLPTAEELLTQIKTERKNYYQTQINQWHQKVKEWEANGKEGKKPGKPSVSKPIDIISENELSELPNIHSNALYLRIANLCDVVRGGSPRPAGDERYYNGSIPFLKVADLTRKSGMFVDSFTYTIKEAGLNKTRLLEKGTLVISNSGATLGVPKITAIEATANDGIAAFLGLTESLSIYLYHFWNSKTKELRNIDQGAAQPNLNTDLLRNYIVPIFCDFEQNQIVQE
ncbi:MAG: restriction endonuclease subunit S, partial [Spirochaetes bacterium]|nr:restriction endonuclease subunit S [Spirochaetota bacterium]